MPRAGYRLRAQGLESVWGYIVDAKLPSALHDFIVCNSTEVPRFEVSRGSAGLLVSTVGFRVSGNSSCYSSNRT